LNVPPVLYSFPGSGNTWCRYVYTPIPFLFSVWLAIQLDRQLIETCTGIYSGSIYWDALLKNELPGALIGSLHVT